MVAFKNEFTYRRFLEDGKEGEFDRLFDDAVERVRSGFMGKKHPMIIGGTEIFLSEQIEERSPIDGRLIGVFQRGDRQSAKKAIDAAIGAFPGWRDTGYRERADILEKAAEIFVQRKFDVSALLSIENGKSRYESVGEVDEAIDFLRYYAADLRNNKGYVRRKTLPASTANVSAGFQGAPGRGERVTIAMKPYGVFGVIAPFNFPISISTGMSAGALAAGNTVVFKPSSTDNMTMATGLEICKIFAEAGVPAGAFNYITGPGSELGDELVVNPKVSGIVFTGSRDTGLGMIKKAYDLGMQKIFIVEMGGKNPVIVSKYADLDAAVSGIASSAFGYCGQKCSAASRVYVHEAIKEEFISKLLDKIRQFKVGDPLRKENYMGPLISKGAFERYQAAVQEASRAGRVVFGGKRVDSGLNGFYVEPAVVEASHQNALFHEELFVPLLAITSYKRFDEAISMANDVKFGLTAGLYSKKQSEIKEFIRSVEAGVIYVNRETGATTGAIVGLHTFVGWKGSGLTGKGTGSRFYLQQFMREQSEAVVR